MKRKKMILFDFYENCMHVWFSFKEKKCVDYAPCDIFIIIFPVVIVKKVTQSGGVAQHFHLFLSGLYVPFETLKNFLVERCILCENLPLGTSKGRSHKSHDILGFKLLPSWFERTKSHQTKRVIRQRESSGEESHQAKSHGSKRVDKIHFFID